MRSFGRFFRVIDRDGNRKLDKEEFYVGLKEHKVKITQKEAIILLEYLDTNRDGMVDYDEFLV